MNNLLRTAKNFDSLTNEGWCQCTSPAISVVVSLYNYSAYITACLDSVRFSDLTGLPGGVEVVVVDDGSMDDSVAVVEKFMAAQPLPLCLVRKKFNSGVSDTRNLGVQFSRAPFIFVLDADNLIRPDCLAAHHRALTGLSDCAFAYGIIDCFDQASRKFTGRLSDREWSVRDLVARPYIDAMAMFRKEILLQLGGYSPEFGVVLPSGCEDYDLWLKLAQAGHVGKFLPQVVGDYRVHPQSLIRTGLPYERKLAVYFSRKFLPLLGVHNDLPTWFGVPREEVAAMNGQELDLRFRPDPKKARLAHRLLGEKFCRSLGKRLARIYCWLQP
jgi:glycosyltransferase involved in cell wall biosynthesis